jgi:maleate isomerase
LGIRDNFSFAAVTEATLTKMVSDVASARPDAIAVFCTNLAAAPIVASLEAQYDLAIHDSVATAVYGAIAAAGGHSAPIVGFGRLFDPTGSANFGVA